MKIEQGETNEILRKIAAPVEEIDDSIRKLVKEMSATMRKKKGVGLAAPQVGKSICVLIATISEEEVAMINPKITTFSAECESGEEGCLSLPGQFFPVRRAREITVEFLDIWGKKKTLRINGFDARVVQHEMDHLNGILFVDRIENFTLESAKAGGLSF